MFLVLIFNRNRKLDKSTFGSDERDSQNVEHVDLQAVWNNVISSATAVCSFPPHTFFSTVCYIGFARDSLTRVFAKSFKRLKKVC